MRKTFKKKDLKEYIDEEEILDEDELNELIDINGGLISHKDNYKATDKVVKSKGTSKDHARKTSQGPGAYYPWGGAFYGGYYTMNEDEDIDFDEDEPWSKPQTDIPQEYLMGIDPEINNEIRRNRDDHWEKRKDVYKGFFEGDNSKEIAESKMKALVDEMLAKKKSYDIVKRTNENDVIRDTQLPEFSELKTKYEKPVIARKLMYFTDLINKRDISGDEVAIIINYFIDTLDTDKISDEYKKLLCDKLMYGEEGE